MLDNMLITRKWSSRGLIWICFILCLVNVLSACGQSQATKKTVPVQTVSPHSLVSDGILTVGSYAAYPPQEFVDSSNDLVGFDVDLMHALGQYMRVQIKFVQLDFRSLLPSLQAGALDAVISAIPITPEIQKKAEFVPYFKGGESLLVANTNPHHIQALQDLCSFTVGVQIGTLEETDLHQASSSCQQVGAKPISIIALADQDDVIHLLTTGKVVATYQDAPVSDYYLHQAPSLFHLGGSVTNPNVEGIAVHKGDTALLKAIGSALQALRKNGTYHFLIMKWGLTTGELT